MNGWIYWREKNKFLKKKKEKEERNKENEQRECENQVTTDIVLELNNLMYLLFFSFFTLLSPPAFFPSYNNIRTY